MSFHFSNALNLDIISATCQVKKFTEEIVRAGSAASLSALLLRLDPVLRSTANFGRLILHL